MIYYNIDLIDMLPWISDNAATLILETLLWSIMSSTKGNSGSMDAKREEFRKYLEKEGVLEYLTKQLVSLIGLGKACTTLNCTSKFDATD